MENESPWDVCVGYEVITLPAWVKKEEVISVLKGFKSVDKVEAEKTLIKDMLDKATLALRKEIESTWDISNELRQKRGQMQVSELNIWPSDSTAKFSSFGRSISFSFKNDAISNLDTIESKVIEKALRELHKDKDLEGIESEIINNNLLTISVRWIDYQVSLRLLNIINASMQHLEEHGANDIDNPFVLDGSLLYSSSKRFPISLFYPSFVLNLYSIDWHVGNKKERKKAIIGFKKLLNEIAFEEGILQNKPQWGGALM